MMVRVVVDSSCHRMGIGRPFEQIVETARREAADLIVMGTHGRTGLGHVILGSVAERVVRLAPYPVLAVKAPESEALPAACRLHKIAV